MKKMFDLMMQKKWLLLVLAIVVVAALVIGIVAVTGCGEKDPNPTEGTSNMGVTDPTGTTGGNGDNTDPTDPEVPGVTDPEVPGVTDPTGTPENPAKPDNPEKPDDYVEPTEPDVTVPEPTEPEPDVEPDPTDPTAPKPDEEPIVGEEHDFEGYTAETITYDVWNSWGSDTRQAFIDEVFPTITPEGYHNFMRQTKYKGYSCGFERHTCRTESEHETLLEEMERGCDYCGKSDCDSFFVVDQHDLFTYVDFSKCPEYDEHKDPALYCQVCGLPLGGASGDVVCNKFKCDATCDYCGKELKAYECHKCIIP